jgi:hypothetical protein
MHSSFFIPLSTKSKQCLLASAAGPLLNAEGCKEYQIFLTSNSIKIKALSVFLSFVEDVCIPFLNACDLFDVGKAALAQSLLSIASEVFGDVLGFVINHLDYIQLILFLYQPYRAEHYYEKKYTVFALVE